MKHPDKPRRGKPEPEAPHSADTAAESGRIAKILARAGVASRRDAERMIAEGRVRVNGKLLDSPAVVVSLADRIEVDGAEIAGIERTRLWVYHKPAGLVTTNRDPEGRKTVFEALPGHLPRVLSIGRLDINTEGLLLLTNDGGLARTLELPETGWLRRYRVRAYGDIDQARLDALRDGIAVDGVLYGAIEATLDRKQGHNVWITMGLREGKNREIKNVLGALGLDVNRLIRISFGPFQLGEIREGDVVEIKSRTLRDQLGQRLIEQSGANFEAPLAEHAAKPESGQKDKPEEKARPVQREWISATEKTERARARFDTKPDRPAREAREQNRDRSTRKRLDDKPGTMRGKKSDGPRADGRRADDGGDKPARRGFVQRNRSANVWMAPGARPVAEAKGTEQERDDKRAPRKPSRPDARAETRRGTFPKSRAKPRPPREETDGKPPRDGQRAPGAQAGKAPGGKGAGRPAQAGPARADRSPGKPAGSKPSGGRPGGKPGNKPGDKPGNKPGQGKGRGSGADRRR